MDLMLASVVKYPTCDHIKKKTTDTVIDEKILKSFTAECRVLPLFEKRSFDYTRMRHYSLQTNEFLQCRWKEFLRRLEGRQRTPFQFPHAPDFHFYKYDTRYEPSQSLANRAQLKVLSFGQTGDSRGYAPVPNDMHTRKTAMNVRKPRQATKNKLKRRVLRY